MLPVTRCLFALLIWSPLMAAAGELSRLPQSEGAEDAAAPEAAAAPGWQLLDNGGGESAAATRIGEYGGAPMFDLPGWETESGKWAAQSGSYSRRKIRPREGRSFLRPVGTLAAARLQQVVALPERLPRYVVAGAFVSDYEGRDHCSVELSLLDAERQELVVVTTTPRGAKAWEWCEIATAVPRGAAFARIALIGKRGRGKNCDSYFDGATLEAFGNGPVSDGVGLEALTVPDIRRRLENERTSWVDRRALGQALATRGSPGARAITELFAAESTDAALRVHLVTIAALSGDRRAAKRVLRAGFGHANVAVRNAAYAALDVAAIDAISELSTLIAEAGKNTAQRTRAIDLLLRMEQRGAIQELRRLSEDVKLAEAILNGIPRSGVSADVVYRPLIARHLSVDGVDALRRAGMRAVGALRDPRFFRHMQELAEQAGSLAELTQWFRYAMAIDPVDGLDAILAVVELEVPHGPAAFLAASERFPAESLRAIRRHAVDSEYELVRLAAVRVLRLHPDASNLKPLETCLRDPDPLVAAEAVAALAVVPGDRAERLLNRLVKSGEPAVAAAALRGAYARSGAGAAGLDRLLEGLRSRMWQVRAAALQLLPPDGVRAARDRVVRAFDDDSWQVRAAAYTAFSRVREKPSIVTLIEQLDAEDGAAIAFLNDALVTLTGLDFGTDRSVWDRWWKSVGTSFVVAQTPKDVERKSSGSTVTYHGIPLRNNRVVFIIDLSGSMKAKIKVDDGARTSTGAKREMTRLDLAKRELIKVLKALKPDQAFNVIGFGSGLIPYEPQLRPATELEIEDACEWVRRLKYAGATNIYDSLEMALGMDGVESIFLLSDGGPTAGKFTDRLEIRRVIHLLNRDRRVRINTIMIGGSQRDRTFMRRLADENDGDNK